MRHIRECVQDIPFILIGDYNIIAVEGKKKGDRFFISQKVCDFRSFIMKIELCDLGFFGAKFIWWNE